MVLLHLRRLLADAQPVESAMVASSVSSAPGQPAQSTMVASNTANGRTQQTVVQNGKLTYNGPGAPPKFVPMPMMQPMPWLDPAPAANPGRRSLLGLNWGRWGGWGGGGYGGYGGGYGGGYSAAQAQAQAQSQSYGGMSQAQAQAQAQAQGGGYGGYSGAGCALQEVPGTFSSQLVSLGTAVLRSKSNSVTWHQVTRPK